ncbi:hypothetical protein MWN34_13840 [Ancylobacter sp. 6x-1]|uniref:DUF4412 domain-containing protein n=1 Tax=Ancylobacter crimeensis TaxID=2579147 RepID=A0ABT0DDG2_9HYPH|nr:hypothetical protein [Ancylobacter crimeensis]MCK0197991.1 hypothetical protein [Ancylobacter crimeensis]
MTNNDVPATGRAGASCARASRTDRRRAIPLSMGAGLAALLLSAPLARAEPVPRPRTDYALSGRVAADKVVVSIVSVGPRLRVDVGVAGKGSVTGFLDRGSSKILLTADMKAVRGNAIEVELPMDYLFLDFPEEAERLKRDRVADEVCDVWRTNTSSGTVDACITPDGIVLRAQTYLRDQPQTLFEALTVTRGPQQPGAVELPSNVKLRRIPKGLDGLLGLDAMLPNLTR